MRLTVAVAAADAERAVAEACAALETGCREDVGQGGETLLRLWVAPSRADADGLRVRLARVGIPARVTTEPESDDWRGAMRDFHRPVEIAGRLLVRPPWADPRPDLLDVVVEPAMAFGTAQHATTRSCLELLAGLPAGGPLLDAGCGSGVLAIAARRLGFDPVLAVDADPLAVQATIDNARRNGVGMRIARRTIGVDPLPAPPTVVANLTATVLRTLAEALPAPPVQLVASGMRPQEVDDVAQAFARLDLRLAARIERDGWATVLLSTR